MTTASSPGLHPIKKEVDVLQGDVAGIKDQLKADSKTQKVEYEHLIKMFQQQKNTPPIHTHSTTVIATTTPQYNNSQAP